MEIGRKTSVNFDKASNENGFELSLHRTWIPANAFLFMLMMWRPTTITINAKRQRRTGLEKVHQSVHRSTLTHARSTFARLLPKNVPPSTASEIHPGFVAYVSFHCWKLTDSKNWSNLLLFEQKSHRFPFGFLSALLICVPGNKGKTIFVERDSVNRWFEYNDYINSIRKIMAVAELRFSSFYWPFASLLQLFEHFRLLHASTCVKLPRKIIFASNGESKKQHGLFRRSLDDFA